MNLSDENLEKELAAFQPVQPNERLRQQISNSLDRPEITNTRPVLKIWPIIAFATAACLVLVFKISSPHSNSEAPETASERLIGASAKSATFQPVSAEQHLLEAFDEGVVLTVNDQPVRKLRYEFVDTVTMVNTNDGSLYTMEIPREEILLLPLTLL